MRRMEIEKLNPLQAFAITMIAVFALAAAVFGTIAWSVGGAH